MAAGDSDSNNPKRTFPGEGAYAQGRTYPGEAPTHNQAEAPRPDFVYDSFNFHDDMIRELYNDFSRIDRDKSGGITPSEVDAFLSRPHLSASQQEMGHFVKDNFQMLAKMSGSPNEVLQSGLNHLKEVFGPDVAAPDPTIISRSTIGGALGGGSAAYLQKGSVGRGAGKGAAVGAAIGVAVYAAETANYNRGLPDRDLANALVYDPGHYPDNSSKLSDDQIFKLADKPVSLETASALVEKFRGTLAKIDFYGGGVVNADMLREAITNNYIPDDEKPLAAALLKDMSEVVKLNDHHINDGLTDYGLHRLALALQADDRGALHEAGRDRLIMTGAGVSGGALWGTIIGAIVGNAPGAAVGAAVGSAIGGGGVFYFRKKDDPSHVAQEQLHLRSDVLKQTVHDLQYLPKKLDEN